MKSRSFKYALLFFALSALLFLTLNSVTAQRLPAPFFYGGEAAGTRYSSLKQINRTNVKNIEIAWQFDSADGAGDPQNQPVIVNGVLYGVTPKHKVVALNAATGKEIWRFDSGLAARGPNRGVTYWSSGNEQRILVGVQHFIYALDAKTGKLIPSFGADGRIDLREGLGRDPQKIAIALTTPGIIYKDLLIVGGRLSEVLPAPPGDIRAYDVRTGNQRWIFHTIPRPGEAGYETWPKDAWEYTGSANNWGGMAVDEKRGIVYVPTGSAASDFYGADRVGDNLYANTLLALNAETGKRIWHFQAVRHDIWDRDFPSPPTLVTVKHNGKNIDAVAQTSKQGWVYLFDRANGKLLFPIASQKYPASTVEGEIAAETQALPTKPAPYSRHELTAEMLTNRTPAAHQWALEQFRQLNGGGQFVPLKVGQETIIFPGFDGGAEWGGSAFDPETGWLYVNANEMAWRAALAENQGGNSGRQLYMRNCATCHGDTLAGSPPQMPSLININQKFKADSLTGIIKQGAGRMPAFPNLPPQDVAVLVQFLLSGEKIIKPYFAKSFVKNLAKPLE